MRKEREGERKERSRRGEGGEERRRGESGGRKDGREGEGGKGRRGRERKGGGTSARCRRAHLLEDACRARRRSLIRHKEREWRRGERRGEGWKG